MYAPFPRTTLHNAAHPHFSKHNRRLGKVSHQMQKIIEDIQGKKCDSYDQKITEQRKTLPEDSRKRSDPRSDETSELLLDQRRTRRRKYSKQKENSLNMKETACQTTILVTADDRLPTKAEEMLPNTADDRLSNTADDRLQNVADERLPSDADDRIRKATNKTLPRTADDISPKSTEAKLPITADDQLRRSTKAPWERPLPPIPEPTLTSSSSEADIYQKVFESLSRSKAKLMENDKKATRIRKNILSLNFVPTNLVAHDVEGRNARNDAARSRYVDIDKMSIERKCKSKLKCQNQRFEENPSHDHSEDDDEHIYETIDDDEHDDLNYGNTKCNNNKLNDIQHTQTFPLSGTPTFTIFTPGRAPAQTFTSFNNEETYLEPVCEFRDIGYMLKLGGSNFSDNSHSAECNETITDFEGYSRDLARSPCGSSGSSIYEETTTIKATYV